ncbi:MAG: glycosyltransferase family 4 protein [Chitinophagaceae bacterium]|nr:glycosyltransferase family 4 protein [Chitinophagaceae bacterium]
MSSDLGELINRQVEQKKFRAIENSVDTDLFYYAERNRVNDVFRFIHVSSMNSLKNAEGLLRAFKAFQQAGGKAELVMVGDTTPAIRDYAASLAFPERSVHFHGEVSNADVAALMRKADCFVLFSNVENSPCVIGESLCCGVPVIATTVGGIAELVTEENGVLVEACDETVLAEAMKKMTEDYSKFDRKKIAENALGRFSYSVIGKKIDDVYQSVLTGK